jgi:hypothetical protein
MKGRGKTKEFMVIHTKYNGVEKERGERLEHNKCINAIERENPINGCRNETKSRPKKSMIQE